MYTDASSDHEDRITALEEGGGGGSFTGTITSLPYTFNFVPSMVTILEDSKFTRTFKTYYLYAGSSYRVAATKTQYFRLGRNMVLTNGSRIGTTPKEGSSSKYPPVATQDLYWNNSSTKDSFSGIIPQTVWYAENVSVSQDYSSHFEFGHYISLDNSTLSIELNYHNYGSSSAAKYDDYVSEISFMVIASN